MKNIALSLFLLCGFVSTAFGSTCNYSSIDGLEYRVKQDYTKIATINFKRIASQKGIHQQSTNEHLSLVENPFKVTGVIMSDIGDLYKTRLSDLRFEDVAVDGRAYRIDNAYNLEVTTSDCEKYRYTGISAAYPEFFKRQFYRNDDKPITTDNFLEFFKGVVNPYNIKAESKYDAFERKTSIYTDFFDKYRIRAQYDSSKKKYDFIEIYMYLTSSVEQLGEKRTWNSIRLAKDTDGNTYDVVQLSSDMECNPFNMFGCTMKERIAVQVNEEFLRKHKDGFRLKLVGNYPFEQEIVGDVVKAFLDETDKLKR